MVGNECRKLEVKPGENLLLAMVEASLPVTFMCTTGKCATCRLRMEIPDGSAAPPSGTERYRLGEQAVQQGCRLACQVFVQGPLTVYL
ncbi:(2Fe-2S)-binding protein [Brevibacillus sp. SYP-B805]|nr:2Fe-2S iron-sulfur cluster-binding protein [Brevibacillus sp. SYP-B805]NGQ94440.1 (2Fe-2S)-binding protein [Brevibacillus sp. SYP-B805]